MNFDTVGNSNQNGAICAYDGLTADEETQLLQAEGDFRCAQLAYDALKPLREKKMKHIIIRRAKSRAKSPDVGERLPLKPVRKRAPRKCVVFAEWYPLSEAPKVALAKSEPPVAPEVLRAKYRQIDSLDGFAKAMKISRRGAILLLKLNGIDVVEEIALAWEDRVSLRDLSAKHGPITQTISNWIKSTGRQVKPRNSNHRYDLVEMHELFDEKRSTNEIAIKMGRSWKTVQRIRDSYQRGEGV